MRVPVVPSGVVTTTSWDVPGGNAGIVAESWWSLTKATFVAATPPTVIVVGPAKSVPETLKPEPPVSGPEVG